MAFAKWLGLIAIVCMSTPAQAANYALGAPFHIVCEGILVSQNGSYQLEVDDNHPSSNPDDDQICSEAIVAEKNSENALKYTLKDSEIARILQTCSVGKVCRIEGQMRGMSHDVFFFVKIDSMSVK
jgi:hypothetical protein